MQVESFSDLPISKEILRGVEALGYKNPTPIQAQSIRPLLEGKDVVGQAQTGTGKTAAFGIPMIERIQPELNQVQGLVLAPTRELAVQISDHLNKLGKYTGVKSLPVYGGEGIEKQIRALKNGVHIVVGTPGRLLDHLARGTLSLQQVKVLVLDEADRMLDMGFINDIEKILAETPKSRQTSLFSATVDKNVLSLTSTYMKKPEKILVSKDEIALVQIKQFYVEAELNAKFPVLCSIIKEQRVERAIVFCKTQRNATKLSKMLRGMNLDAKPLHGGLTQPQRDSVVEQFRRGKLDFLVATDLASRGLDIKEISHIINFNVPPEPTVYFHRIGRTARMDAEGTSITLVSKDEMPDFYEIKALTKTRILKLAGDFQEIIESSKGQAPLCADCGKPCSLDFKPTEGRPVYCAKCYAKHRPARPVAPGARRGRWN